MPNRFDCLNAAAAAVADREGVYGRPEANLSAVEEVFLTLLSATPEEIPDGVTAALFLCALKLVRAAVSPQHADNWVDLAGYASLGFEVAADRAS